LGEASVGISTQTRKTLTSAHGGGPHRSGTDDPTIITTIAAYDVLLVAITEPHASLACFAKLNGYGEHNDGSDFDGTSVGRARLHASRSPPCFNLGPAFPSVEAILKCPLVG